MLRALVGSRALVPVLGTRSRVRWRAASEAAASGPKMEWEKRGWDTHNRVLSSEAAERNKGPLLDVLLKAVPAGACGSALEVAAGSGQHAAHCAPAFPNLVWFPTELEDKCFASIAHHTEGVPNVRPPSILDCSTLAWETAFEHEGFELVLAVNLCHISPVEATQGLVRGAAALLAPGGVLAIYGPFKCGGEFTSESNANFDASLRSRDPRWGYRDSEYVMELAIANGLQPVDVVEMPANNLTLLFRKGAQ